MRDRRSFTRVPIGAAAFLYVGLATPATSTWLTGRAWTAAAAAARLGGGLWAAAASTGALAATTANAMMRFICPPLDATYRRLARRIAVRRGTAVSGKRRPP